MPGLGSVAGPAGADSDLVRRRSGRGQWSAPFAASTPQCQLTDIHITTHPTLATAQTNAGRQDDTPEALRSTTPSSYTIRAVGASTPHATGCY